MSVHPRAIPEKSTVLIVGAASFIGAHIVHAFLKLGYKVRGSDYDYSKAAWLIEEVFKSDVTNGTFELVIVPDILADKAFDDAIKGVSAVVYVANVQVTPNPHQTIPQNISGILNALRTAAKEPSIKRFVMTSSWSASFNPSLEPNACLDASSWNESAVKIAWEPPPYDLSRFTAVYMASKSQTERALWKFVNEERPPFTVNSVIPSYVTGKVFSKAQNLSSTICLKGLYDGDTSLFSAERIHSYVSVRDVALLHAAAVIDVETANERIYAIAQHTDWNDFLSILRKLYPERKFMDDIVGLPRFQGRADTSVGLGLLRKWGRQDTWTSLEDGIKDTLGYVE